MCVVGVQFSKRTPDDSRKPLISLKILISRVLIPLKISIPENSKSQTWNEFYTKLSTTSQAPSDLT
jgi:hypothetical protein